MPQAKKLVLVLATFTLISGTQKAQKMRVLHQVPCICYEVQFQKDKNKDFLALLDFGSEINVMTPIYTL